MLDTIIFCMQYAVHFNQTTQVEENRMKIKYFVGYPAIPADIYIVLFRQIQKEPKVAHGDWLQSHPYIQFMVQLMNHGLHTMKNGDLFLAEGGLAESNIKNILFIKDEGTLPFMELLSPTVTYIHTGQYTSLATQLYRPMRRNDPTSVFELLYGLECIESKCPELQTISINLEHTQFEARRILTQKKIPFIGLK